VQWCVELHTPAAHGSVGHCTFAVQSTHAPSKQSVGSHSRVLTQLFATQLAFSQGAWEHCEPSVQFTHLSPTQNAGLQSVE
jgi:hypothetical protein